MKRGSASLMIAVLGAGFCFGVPAVLAQAQVVATVDGKAITEADLRLAEREMGANPELSPEDARRVLLDVLIQRQVLAAAAEQAKLQASEDFDQRLAYDRRTLLQQLFLERARQTLTEAESKKFYDERFAYLKPEGEVRARHILVEKEDQAKAIAERVRNGADFANLAKAVSADPDTARRGGILGWRIKSELPDKLAAAAFALEKAGDLSGPVQTEAGWHLVMLEERRMRPAPSFTDLKGNIVRVLAKNKAKELARALREKAKVVYKDPKLELAVAPPWTEVAAPAAAPAAPGPTTAAAPAVPAPAAAPAPIEMPATAKVTRWRHDGSLMKLLADGERVVMQFDVPREELEVGGIKPGTQLFAGVRRRGTYSGEASTFSPQCGVRAFPVRGQAAVDGNSFTVRGSKPVFNANCSVASEQDEVLVFEYAGQAGR